VEVVAAATGMREEINERTKSKDAIRASAGPKG
jgi:hypothetical protein